jgi:hypothetical protein
MSIELYCIILKGHEWMNLHIRSYVWWCYLDCSFINISDTRNFVIFILKVLLCSSL